MNRMILLLALSLSFTALLSGQTGAADQHRASTEWLQIRTPHFTVIFPDSFRDEGRKTAALAERLRPLIEKDWDQEIPPYPLILNNQNFTANGYVTLSPRHSQWYSTPPQGGGLLGSGDWFALLASHEIRHMVQYARFNRGATSLAKIFFGQLGQQALTSLAFPLWFFEGDAVLSETRLSNGGRGRLPDFHAPIKAALQNNLYKSYQQAYLGSRYLGSPGWYRLGYYLTAYLRQKHGMEALNQIVDKTAAFSFSPLAFHSAVKEVTGAALEEHLESMTGEMQRFWETHERDLAFHEGAFLPAPEAAGSRLPLGKAGGGIWSLRTSPDTLPVLTRLTDGKEEIIKAISPFDTNIAFRDPIFVWAERLPHWRWGQAAGSRLVAWNSDKGQTKAYTLPESQLYAPALSHNGEWIAAVALAPDGGSRIVVLDRESGTLLADFAGEAGELVSQPSWERNDAGLLFCRQQGGQKTISHLKVEPRSQTAIALTELQDLLPWGSRDLQAPCSDGEKLYFLSGHSGISEIYALDISSSAETQAVPVPLTLSRYGMRGLVLTDEGRLLSSAFDERGYRAVQIDPLEPHPGFHNRPYPFQDLLTLREGRKPPLYSPPSADEPQEPEPVPEPYSPLFNGLSLHSWGLTGTERDNEVGLMVLAEDPLNIYSLQLYGAYDTVTGSLSAGIDATYAGSYPILSIQGRYGREKAFDGTDQEEWDQVSGGMTLALPVNLSRGIYQRSLNLQASISGLRNMNWHAVSGSPSSREGSLILLQYAAAAANFMQMNSRDIYPAWGQLLSLTYLHSPLQSGYSFLKAGGELYFPGLFPHHSLSLKGTVAWDLPDSLFRYPDYDYGRGFLQTSPLQDLMLSFQGDYQLPLVYPDLAIGNLLYFKRIRQGFFFDVTAGWDGTGFPLLSRRIGGEFMFDFHLFNLPVEFSWGVRLLYRLDDRSWRAEETLLLFGLNF